MVTIANLTTRRANIPEPRGFLDGAAGPLGQWLDERPVREARRSIGDLGGDYTAAANKLLSAGDVEGARTIASLGQVREAQAFRQQEAAQDRDWQERKFAADQDYKRRYLGIMGARASNQEAPSGYRMTPAGNLEFIPGGPADPSTASAKASAREKPPSGYRWSDTDPNKLEAIPGGPGEKIDAEVAARLGLTKSFLGQITDIKDSVEKGELTGPIDGPLGAAGFGRPAELRRQIQSGVDALIRNLTGAGMPQSEADAYAARYAPTFGDSAKTITSKLNQLERELVSTAETLGRGRGGSGFVTGGLPPASSAASTSPKGGLVPGQTVVNGFTYMGGDPNKQESWRR